MNNLTVETEDTFASLLELAANNDVEGFKRSIERDLSGIDEVGLWYGRKKGSKHMVLDHRTPLMVAAIYGSTDVVKLILSVSNSDVNRSCGLDKSTALHCAASGGSINALDVVKVLLEAGADLNLVDANGHCPFDVIVVSPKFQDLKFSLEKFLATNGSNSNSNSPPLSPSPENRSLSSGSDSTSSPQSPKFNEISVISASEKKEYPIDPSLPDIKNSIYSTDEFRMFSFKVRPCSRAYSHDWTECPFVHPGENARRRDPRKYHYSCVPCPDFRKGACRRGDMCEYAHGVFECWLHPAQYRTRLCKDGTNCNRRVCFFAHTPEELRPLYVSTGSAVPSPRSGSTAMDFAAAMNLLPGSPSSPLTPPMSPSAHGISSNMGWPQPNVPSLHLPGSNLQSSRLRSSLNARDIAAEDLDMFSDFDLQQKQLLNELSRLSLNRSTHSKTLTTLSNLEDLFSSESSSPRYSPTPKSAYLNQFQQQQIIASQSPMNANFSPKTMDQPLMQTSFGVPSMSPHGVDPISPMGSRVSMLSQRQQQQFRSLSSRDLGSNSSAIGGNPSWAKWGSSNGKPDWSVNADEFGKIRRSSSFELGNNGEEPDLSWVQSLVKESPEEMKEKPETGTLAGVGSSSESSDLHSSQIESIDQSVLSAWLEQKQLDQLMAQ
ncbi:zinc finger CCCH domain-containing protein 30-like [Actinidia eriantha]|uniref:zinc finger CCCH domain-containing protein 30-like n=1 Tax=Actinidia eriantha TaxID=165200 RepID=UPI0025866BB3|nr:zinc finger CCCH domain-containing protein 30-like [Actinidia eriantha]